MGEYVNSKQVRFDKSFVSCGVLEVHHLPKQTANQTMFAIATALYHKANPRPAAFLIFSDVVTEEKSRGQQLADEFRKKDFGMFLETNSAINPRTGNTIKVYLLEIDHDKFKEFYKEELANRIED